MTGTYLDARTPPAGTVTTAVLTRSAAGRNAATFPTVEAAASYSPSDDTSLHVRSMLASLGAEVAARWRFVHSGPLHLALAPSAAFSYWPASRGHEEDLDYQSLGPGLNLLTRLNVLATIDLGAVDLDLAGFAGISRLPEMAVPAGDDAPYAFFNYEMQGVVPVAGAAIGLGRKIRPTLEWMRFIGHENVWTVTVVVEN